MDVLADVEPGIVLLLGGCGKDFVDRAVAAVMSYFRNLTNFHLPPSPAAWCLCSFAEAIERVFLGSAFTAVHEIGTVAIGAEGNQIANVALRAFHAMSNTERHLIFDMHVSGHREPCGTRVLTE